MNDYFKYDGKVTTEFWRFNPRDVSPKDFERIEDIVFGCKIVDFLAEKMDWGPGAISEGMITMDEYDPQSHRCEISIDIPVEIYEKYEDEIMEMLYDIDGALDDYAGGWGRNC